MGINGLLKALDSITHDTTLSELGGRRVAVDGYIWLHRGILTCGRDLCKGIANKGYVSYFINRIVQLQRHSLDVIVVFDGDKLTAKGFVEDDRAKNRADCIRLAEEQEAKGMYVEANAFFAKAVDVTPQLAYEVSLALKVHNVRVIVAPYEADAQLAFLSRNNHVDFVISEDSDLLVYGCTKVLYKLDFKTETGRMVAAVLTGCDYLSNLPGIGIKSAHSIAVRCESLLTSSGHEDITSDFFATRLVMFIKISGADFIPDEFTQSFKRAIFTFNHQVVFDPTLRSLVPLTPVDFLNSVPDFAGVIYDSITACGVADCMLDPESKKPFKPTVGLIAKLSLPHVKKKIAKPSRNTSISSIKLPSGVDGMPTLMDCWAFRNPIIKDESPIDLPLGPAIAVEEKPIICVEDESIDLSSDSSSKIATRKNLIDLNNFNFRNYRM